VLEHELQGQKFSTNTEMKQATAATLHPAKKCIACEGRYFEKETVPKPQDSSDSSEQHEYSHYLYKSRYMHHLLLTVNACI
jgi:hypothetical protein